MNIYEMIEWLEEQPNKELQVLISAPAGWFSPCYEDSGEEQVEENVYFLIKPCYGHGDDKIEFDLKADDFELDQN